jgi:hypothetical protein
MADWHWKPDEQTRRALEKSAFRASRTTTKPKKKKRPRNNRRRPKYRGPHYPDGALAHMKAIKTE